MDLTTAAVVLIPILLVLSGLGFFAVFRQKGKLQIDTRLGNLRAEGENLPPPTSIPAGASAEDVKATGDVLTNSTSEGGVRAKGIDSGGKVTTTHTPGATPPKP